MATQSPLPLCQPWTEACVVPHGKVVSDGPHPGENGPLKHKHDITCTGVLSTGNELLENLSGAVPWVRVQGTEQGEGDTSAGPRCPWWWKRRAGCRSTPELHAAPSQLSSPPGGDLTLPCPRADSSVGRTARCQDKPLIPSTAMQWTSNWLRRAVTGLLDGPFLPGPGYPHLSPCRHLTLHLEPCRPLQALLEVPKTAPCSPVPPVPFSPYNPSHLLQRSPAQTAHACSPQPAPRAPPGPRGPPAPASHCLGTAPKSHRAQGGQRG